MKVSYSQFLLMVIQDQMQMIVDVHLQQAIMHKHQSIIHMQLVYQVSVYHNRLEQMEKKIKKSTSPKSLKNYVL